MAGGAEHYRLPFDGRWFVMHAGDTLNVNHHMRVRAQWHGIDFMKAGGEHGRALMKSNGKELEDCYSWGETVLAPVDGKVEVAVDGLPDNPIGVSDKENIAGNHVAIRTRSSRYAFIAHLQRGSVCVKHGDEVTAGQAIGRCGNSGNTTAPHIHLHTQDVLALNHGHGQNMVFHNLDVELTGLVFENVTWPLIRGLFVWNHGR
ncbi:MAG TPA: M23 family metallopeptidase [Verrucomicrobiae bacterium]|nr:M23 family metallopeptidase [Verrucomicrobiae bacterium]